MPMKWLLLFSLNWVILISIMSLLIYLPFHLMKKKKFFKNKFTWTNSW